MSADSLLLDKNLDSTDRRILETLQVEGRATLDRIAKLVGTSRSSVSRRIGRLESEGVITGYSAQIEWHRLGWDLPVLMELDFAPGTTEDEISELLDQVLEVERGWTVTGDADCVLLVCCRDTGHLREVIAGLTASDIVMRTRSRLLISNLR